MLHCTAPQNAANRHTSISTMSADFMKFKVDFACMPVHTLTHTGFGLKSRAHVAASSGHDPAQSAKSPLPVRSRCHRRWRQCPGHSLWCAAVAAFPACTVALVGLFIDMHAHFSLCSHAVYRLRHISRISSRPPPPNHPLCIAAWGL